MKLSWRRTLLAGLLLLVVVVAIFVATTPGTPKNQLIGLGDSYASGEGINPFSANSDTSTNQCHESINGAYAVIAAKSLGLNGVNQACSGATTSTMLNGSGNEPKQLLNLDRAKDITITIGGNDIDALGAVLNQPTPEQVKTELAQLQPKLVNAYKQVQAAAPTAHVWVTDYPDILPASASQNCFLKQSAIDSLNGELEALNSTIKNAATQAKVGYVEFATAFKGHELCSTQPYVNGLDLANFDSSLHPNMSGQIAMANAVTATIRRA